MAKQLLLHIGTAKTGSTSIQRSLQHAAQNDELGDINYPLVRGESHNFLATVYQAFDQLPRQYRGKYRDEGLRSTLGDETRSFKAKLFQSIREHHKTVLSAEYLSRFGPDSVRALRTDISSLGVDDIKVLVYVRHPASRYLSFVQQSLKAASTFESPSTWRDQSVSRLLIWSEEFDRVNVRPFVRDRLVGRDVVLDFLSVMSDFFGLTQQPDLPHLVENRSLSAEGMVVLQRYRTLFHPTNQDVFKKDSTSLVEILERSHRSIPQTAPRLSREVEELVTGRHDRDIVNLRRQFGVDLGDSTSNREIVGRRWRGLSDDGDIRSVTDILESYSEDIVGDLLYHCLRQLLMREQGKRSDPPRVENEGSHAFDLPSE